MTTHLPTRAGRSGVFDQKQQDPRAPPSLVTRSRPQQLIFVLKGKHLQMWTRRNKETAEALKGTQTDTVKLSEPWEKCLDGCSASNGERFEGD